MLRLEVGHYHGHLRVKILCPESLSPVLGPREQEAEALVVQPKSGSRLNIGYMKKFLYTFASPLQ